MKGSLAGIMPGMRMGMRVMVRGKMSMIKTLIKAWTSMSFFLSLIDILQQWRTIIRVKCMLHPNLYQMAGVVEEIGEIRK